eukprot:NODE_2_length_91304_cov_0.692462.p45 type:complete len:210 gc:universal NODE_2_length_91304_cov_0.692462:64883-65512(+)
MAKGDASTTEILKYLKETNRPYSATDISLNLQLKKTATVKTLAEMAENGTLAFKENGKQVIYYMPQLDDGQTAEEVDQEKNTIKQLMEDITVLKITEQENNLKIHEIKKYPDDDDLDLQISQMKEKISKLSASLEEFQKNPIDPKEKDRINKSYTDMMKLWKSRKAKCKFIVEELAEKMEKKPTEIVEVMGLETDEDCEQLFENYNKYL